MAENETRMKMTAFFLPEDLKEDCSEIAKKLDSDLSKEVRKMLKKFHMKHKSLLDD
jgi:hypothetical protein